MADQKLHMTSSMSAARVGMVDVQYTNMILDCNTAADDERAAAQEHTAVTEHGHFRKTVTVGSA